MSANKTVVLRSVRDEDGIRHLEASLTAKGDLVILGQDLGAGVESIFGVLEYEWTWTIRADDVSRLRAALGASADVLTALRARFSGDQAEGIRAFLDTHGVRYESWSKLGD